MNKNVALVVPNLKNEAVPRKTQKKAVPKKTKLNIGLSTVILMDCIAAIPCSTERRARAAITNVEKAKNKPAIKPVPSAEAKVKPKSKLAVMFNLPYASSGGDLRVFGKIARFSS